MMPQEPPGLFTFPPSCLIKVTPCYDEFLMTSITHTQKKKHDSLFLLTRLSPLQKQVGKVVDGFGKKSCVGTVLRKPGNTVICVTNCHDMTLAVKVALNPYTTNILLTPLPQDQIYSIIMIISEINMVNPFPHNDTFGCPSETSLLKTPWKKEKLLVMSNFSFSHNVVYLFG